MLAVLFQILKQLCCFVSNMRQSEQNIPFPSSELHVWSSHNKHTCLKIWLILFLCIGYCGNAQLTIWLPWFDSLWIFSIFCFLPIAILSRSSQARFVCRYVLLSLNFLESFSIFSMDFFCLSKKVKEALLISGTTANIFYLGPNRWNITVLFYETIFTDLFASIFFVF